MATYTPAKRATAFIMYVGLPSQASPATMQSNPTIASGDFKVSKDGGALANLTNLPAVTPASSKMVQLSLTGTEMTADNVTIVCSDASGSEWSDVLINIHTAAQQFDDLATQTSVNTIDGIVDDIIIDTAEIGTAGAGLTNINLPNQTMDIVGNITGNLSGSVGSVTGLTASNLDATISSRMASYTQPTGFLAATFPSDPADQSLIIAATDALLAAVGDVPTGAENAAALLAVAFEGAETVQDFLRLSRAVLYGESNGQTTTTVNYRDKTDAKNRVTGTMDSDGNRTAVTLDAT